MKTTNEFERLKELDINSKSNTQRAKISLELERLSQISDIISMSYIARNYFNKSKSWLSQRVNEFEVNGKPAKFTPEEVSTLNFAFNDISKKIGSVRISC